jgi:hypothetical protein
LVPTIKAVKGLLRNHNISIKSFFTEIVCAKYLPIALKVVPWNWKLSHSLWYILQKLAENLHQEISIPGSYTAPVGSGLSGLIGLITPSRIQKLSEHALALHHNPNTSDADWEKFFNGYGG